MQLAIATTKVVTDPGRLYRPMFCKACGDTRLHSTDFIACERTQKGYFVWFKTRCTGVEPEDSARRRTLLREVKDCGRQIHKHIALTQWRAFVKGTYY